VFSPAHSLIRGLLKEKEPKWITIRPPMGDKWSDCLQRLGIGRVLFNISLDTTASYLYTEIGTIALGASSSSNMTPGVTDPQNPRYQGWGLSPGKRGNT